MAPLAGSSRTRAHGRRQLMSRLRPTASSLYSLRDGASVPRRPCWTFTSCFLLSRFPALPWSSYLWRMFGRLFSAAYFWLPRFLCIPGIGSTATMVLLATQLQSNLQLCLLLRVLVNQENGFLCWSLWRSVNCRVSCVFGGLSSGAQGVICRVPGFHLSVWLKCWDFPEVESPAGFAALEGSARFQGPAHQGFSGLRCLSSLRDQHTEGAVPRTGRATLKDHYCGRVTRRDS